MPHTYKTIIPTLLFIFLILFSMVFKLNKLDLFPNLAMDEYYYVNAAREMLSGNDDPNLEHHPPLAKEFIALGIKLFGDNPWGWRVPSVIAGTFGMIFTYLLAFCLFKNRTIAFLSVFILNCSLLWFLMSRVGMLDIFASAFLLAAVYFIYQYSQTGVRRNAVFLGISFGLLLASKWIAFLVFFLFPFMILPFAMKPNFRFSWKNQLGRRLITDIIIIVGLSLGIYLFTYFPFFLHHGPVEFIKTQWHIFTRHMFLIKKDPENYSPYTAFVWPFLPSFSLSNVALKNETTLAALAMIENPILLWAFLPTLVGSFILFFRKRNLELLFLSLTLMVLYIPWLILDRPKYFYYMLPLMPVLSVTLGFCLHLVWEIPRWGKLVVGIYLALLLIYFFAGLPLVEAIPVPYSYLYKVFFFWPWVISKI